MEIKRKTKLKYDQN